MQGYVPARGEAFAQSRKCFRELEDWMASEEAAGLQHVITSSSALPMPRTVSAISAAYPPPCSSIHKDVSRGALALGHRGSL